MRLGINLTDLIPGKIGGMENYMRSLVYYFPLVNPYHQYVVFLYQEVRETFADVTEVEFVIIDRPPTRQALSDTLKQNIKYNNIEVWLSPLLILDPLDPGIPCAFTIPDMQHEYYPEFFSRNILDWRHEYYKLSAQNADAILTLSQDSKKDIVKFLDVNPDKIHYFYLGLAEWFDPSRVINNREDVKLKYKLPDQFIFYPANTWAHKNHKTLIKAFDLIGDKYPGIHLVFTGFSNDAQDEVLSEIRNSKYRDRIIFLGYVEKSDIPMIYKNALCLAFPSLFEGFGIPIVEAMSSGCPVICSNNTSIPEVGGDAVLYCDPLDPADISGQVCKLIEDKTLREELIEKGLERAKMFSYEKCAEGTLGVLESLYANTGKIPDIYLNSSNFSNQRPLISIITPSYNQGKYIERTIKSVIDQNYSNIEYIIMDGGSTDDSVDIIKKYAGKYPYIKWESKKDKGQTDAMNQGIRIARGDIVAYLNSDDTYEPGAFNMVTDYFMRHPESRFVFGRGRHIAGDDKFIENYPSRDTDFAGLHKTCSICQPTAFWKYEIINEIGLFDENLHFAMDYDYWIRISKKYKLDYLPYFLANTRFYEDTKTLSQRKQVHKEIVEVIGGHYETVHMDWIYAYAHHSIKNQDRSTKIRNLIFIMKLIFYTMCYSLYYNKMFPSVELKHFIFWIISSIRRNENRN